MIAAEAIAAGMDTPALCELAGLPRNADTNEIRDLFEQALAEVGIELPAPELAQRYALRRLAMRLIDEDLTLTVLVRGEWEEAPVATEEERVLVALIPALSVLPLLHAAR
ncbi:hypothetical protein ABIA32_000386 [Streptacidiphilus sp. MAP12-20]|uniref:hypothetical protein n=1 Tax=Streptacidiphilus sp. MAP12-20 TaxID=3156299 RepID=UPI003519B916